MANKNTTIHIATSTIIKIVLVVLGLFFLYFIRDIIVILFSAIILAVAFDGPIEFLDEKVKMPRFFAVMIVYFSIFIFIGIGFYLIVPSLSAQINHFMNNTSVYIGQARNSYRFLSEWKIINFNQILEAVSKYLTGIASNIVSGTINFFSAIFVLVITFVIAIYISMQEKGLSKFFLSIMPQRYRSYTIDVAERIQKRLGKWIRGQIIIAVIIGLLVYIGLSLLLVPYALTFGIIATILELVPYLGPIIASVPAILVSFFINPLSGFFVILLYVVIQQIETHILSPLIMKKAVGVNSLLIIFSFLIGAKVAGFWGIVLAVPIAAIVNEFARDLIDLKV